MIALAKKIPHKSVTNKNYRSRKKHKKRKSPVEAEKQNAEMTRFGEKQVNRFLEREKQAQEEAFTSSLTVEEAAN